MTKPYTSTARKISREDAKERALRRIISCFRSATPKRAYFLMIFTERERSCTIRTTSERSGKRAKKPPFSETIDRVC